VLPILGYHIIILICRQVGDYNALTRREPVGKPCQGLGRESKGLHIDSPAIVPALDELDNSADLLQLVHLGLVSIKLDHQDAMPLDVPALGSPIIRGVLQRSPAPSCLDLLRHFHRLYVVHRSEIRLPPYIRRILPSGGRSVAPLGNRLSFSLLPMGTPHRGPTMTWRLVGLAASGLVRYSDEERATYRQLVDDGFSLSEPLGPGRGFPAAASAGCQVQVARQGGAARDSERRPR
jgi:hypothetical protein